MNRLLKTALFALVPSLALTPVLASRARAAVSPSSVQIKVKQVMISTSSDCSSPVSVNVNASPVYEELTANPTLLSGAIAAGTYKCLMIDMSSLIKYTPATGDGASCVAGTQVTRDLCRQSTFAIPGGGTGSCTGTAPDDGVESYFWIYFSTTGNSSTSSGQTPSTAMPLASPLVVNGSSAVTFVADFDGKLVSDTDGSGNPICDCNPPAVSFR